MRDTTVAAAIAAWVALAMPGVLASPAIGQEVTLYTGNGEPVAYIAVNDGITIYLWDGQPVANLHSSNSSFHVYGFNGRHLGWFERGAIWMPDGYAACAVREALTVVPQIDPVKAIREIKPIKSIREIASLKPLLTNRFGAMPCSLFLAQGK